MKPRHHHELDWHRQSSLSRFNNGALPMRTHTRAVENKALRKRVLKARARNRYNPLEAMDGMNMLGMIIILFCLAVDLFTPGGLIA